ncbi:MAG: hypothetical protein A4E36_01470 [Methanoregulaceae archaeon PtaB.Bin009]|jgi:energy-converting hydrogenase A subunit M|nr:MAG: hypothetical protein A4E36_01470 [Methanoregulaceae archaeon PtaB.Bin009]OPY41698.1 MAG: hypothetical protein A4E41_00784 [Methanoregulaceae archaeon PtaU1.Bin066]HNQ30442.1 DUF1959 domain-containing protein [Methanolinea sp.]HNS82402.1 DUF1959 domain-containing protein [Methanolinea sp.]
MREPIYEKDLIAMKYAILESRRHDRMVREIAAEFGIPQNRMRRYLMDCCDMLLLENLPARYEQGKRVQEEAPEPERQLGAHLFTRAVPLLGEDRMLQILDRVKELARGGTPIDQAVRVGKEMIREAITG